VEITVSNTSIVLSDAMIGYENLSALSVEKAVRLRH
jgi:hypothetical protein